ncbi:MAG: type II secretion system protein [Bacillota bacterium]
MLQKCRNILRNEKGLTLIELLAVVVILGIIAAIAVPSIGGLIDNSKKDAHVANAQQMVSSAKLAVAGDANLQKDGTFFLTLDYLEKGKFLDIVKDPDGSDTSYKRGSSELVEKTELADNNVSYVKVVNGEVTEVKLVNNSRGVQDEDGKAVSVNSLARGQVHDTSSSD